MKSSHTVESSLVTQLFKCWHHSSTVEENLVTELTAERRVILRRRNEQERHQDPAVAAHCYAIILGSSWATNYVP